MEPENRIKRRVRYVAQVPPISHQSVDTIVHILDRVVVAAAVVSIGPVGKTGVI